MDKKVMLFITLILVSISPFIFATSTIHNYSVPPQIPLNQNISATGVYSADGNLPVVNIQCSFFFLDSNGNLIDRASDQYTTGTGRIAMQPFILTEPNFVRGQFYTLRTDCSTATQDANFQVIQKQDLVSYNGFGIYPAGVQLDMLWWQQNAYAVVFLVFFIILFGGLALYAITRVS